MKYCTHCGGQLNEEAVVCIHCGCAITGTNVAPNGNQQAQKLDVLGLMGFIFSLIFPFVGLILSIISLNSFKNDPNKSGRGFAVAGLVISVTYFALVLIAFFMLWFVCMLIVVI